MAQGPAGKKVNMLLKGGYLMNTIYSSMGPIGQNIYIF